MSEQESGFAKSLGEFKPEETPHFEKITYPLFDPAAVKALTEKLEEYKSREQTADSRYKIALINELLVKGTTDQSLAWDLTSQENNSGREFDQEAFDNAFLVIKDYVENAGKNVGSGTGFNYEKHIPIGERIRNAETLEQICDALRDAEGLQGSKKFYTAEELVTLIHEAKIDKVFGGGTNLQRITNTWGLRDKVAEILRRENETTRLAA